MISIRLPSNDYYLNNGRWKWCDPNELPQMISNGMVQMMHSFCCRLPKQRARPRPTKTCPAATQRPTLSCHPLFNFKKKPSRVIRYWPQEQRQTSGRPQGHPHQHPSHLYSDAKEPTLSPEHDLQTIFVQPVSANRTNIRNSFFGSNHNFA